jgi:hypothetical protein
MFGGLFEKSSLKMTRRDVLESTVSLGCERSLENYTSSFISDYFAGGLVGRLG